MHRQIDVGCIHEIKAIWVLENLPFKKAIFTKACKDLFLQYTDFSKRSICQITWIYVVSIVDFERYIFRN